MSELIGTYDNNNVAEYWHKYFYNNKNQTILICSMIFPTIKQKLPGEFIYSDQATFYTYDNKDRIIKDSTSFSNSVSPVVHSYNYDNGGK